MALIKCPECGKEISDSAKACPHCGHKNSNKKGKLAILLILLCCVALLIVVALCIVMTKPKNSLNTKYFGGLPWGTSEETFKQTYPRSINASVLGYMVKVDDILDIDGVNGQLFFKFDDGVLTQVTVKGPKGNDLDSPELIYQKLEKMFGPPDTGKYSPNLGDDLPTWTLKDTIITFYGWKLSFEMR